MITFINEILKGFKQSIAKHAINIKYCTYYCYKMKFKIIWFITINLVSVTIQDTSIFYKAGVYEHYLPANGLIEDNIEQYTIAIEDAKNQEADLLIFPENGLFGNINYKNRQEVINNASYVPNPADNVVPCNHTNYSKISQVVHKFSCLAYQHSLYIVINLPEKYECNDATQLELNDTRQCAADKFYLFNTNVVFDRNGKVVARYRKYNLYGEIFYNTTLTPELSVFITDFNETFGLFTCFDILFEEPALTLIKNNVKNIIFTTRWMSELPFLTAVQIQGSWAYSNNVTLFASNINRPNEGSSGFGIYLPLQNKNYFYVTGNAESNLLIVTIARNHMSPSKNNIYFKHYISNSISVTSNQIPFISPIDVDGIKTVNYTLSNVVFKKLNLMDPVSENIICQRELCCEFKLRLILAKNLSTPVDRNKRMLNYFVVIQNGPRSFVATGTRKAGIQTCAVIGCEGDFSQCGKKVLKYDDIIWPVEFKEINITANFPQRNSVIHFPNSLNSSLVPLPASDWIWERKNASMLLFRLVRPQKELRTFGIYGRNFDMDSKSGCQQNNFRSVSYSRSDEVAVSKIILSVIILASFFRTV